MKNAVIIGSSVLAVHMASYLESNDFNIIGFFDDYKQKEEIVSGNVILGRIEDIKNFSDKFDEAFIGIGYNHLKEKEKIYGTLNNQKVKFGKFIHPTSYFDKTSCFGPGSFILPNCTVDKNVIIGRNVFLNPNCCISHDSSVGNETFLAPGVTVSGLTNVGSRCFLGAGSVIKDNLTVCDDVIIGAGSVVVKNISEPGLYYGTPAIRHK